MLFLCCIGAMTAWAANANISINDINKWEKYPTDSLYRLAMNYINVRSMPDSALLCLTIITNRYYEKDPEGKEKEYYAMSLHDTGYLYLYYYGDLFKAHTYLLQSQEAAQKYETSNVLPFVYLNLANLNLADFSIKQRKPDFNKVIEMYKKAFAITLKTDNKDPLQPIFINMIQVAFGEQKMELVWNEVDQYEKLEISSDVYERDFAKHLCKAMIQWKKGETDSALLDISNIPIGNQLPTKQKKQLMTIKHDLLYHANLFLNHKEEALSHLRQMEKLAKQENNASGLADVYHYYYEFYNNQNDTQNANHYELMWLRSKDEAIGQTRLNELKDAEFLMDISKLNDQMKDLSKQRLMQRRILIIVSVFLLLTLIMFAIMISNHRKLKRSHRALYEKNMALLAVDEQKVSLSEKPKYGTSQLDDETGEQLLEKIKDFMYKSDEIYQESFSIAKLAELIDAKQHYISQVINSKTGQNFSTMLSEFRIKEACRRIQDKERYGNYTIEGIGNSVGFKSRPYFVQLFKKYTGLTPSAYQKMARERT